MWKINSGYIFFKKKETDKSSEEGSQIFPHVCRLLVPGRVKDSGYGEKINVFEKIKKNWGNEYNFVT